LGSDSIAGVVVGHVDLGEADRIIRILTAEEGRIAVVARGARSSRKRFAGLLDLGMRIRVTRARGRGRLARLADAELVAAVDRARTDIERLALLAYGCELAGKLAGEDAPAPKLARLLVVWLELLEGEAQPGVASRQAFEAKALTFAGLLPDLVQCALCSEALDSGTAHFDFETGLVHPECGSGASVSTAGLHALEALRRTPLFDTPGLPPADVGWLLSDFAQHQVSSELKSRSLLADVQQRA
jgi:DNA repair protein RecO (recombination protein O)